MSDGMTMKKNIMNVLKKTKDRVVYFLKKKPEYKDDDLKLVAAYWFNELKALGYEHNYVEQKFMPFLERYAAGELTPADIITRARRKAQEEDPELRGTKWEDRHDQEEIVRQNINDYSDENKS